ncbi:hypothetical protein [Microbacterium binotii]|uniref:Uncharacterized protein n=1 Tax=Microbacterium binotii TaxID=462710 RepID=A0ABN3P7X4_9MICO
MTVTETVADLAQRIRDADSRWHGEWSDEHGPLAWKDDDGADLIVVPNSRTRGLHDDDEWRGHPAVFLIAEHRISANQDVALAGWVLDDGALEAVLAAGVDADYARDAHGHGLRDAEGILDAWTSGIPLEYLGALS